MPRDSQQGRESLAKAIRQSEGCMEDRQNGQPGFPWEIMIDVGDLSASEFPDYDYRFTWVREGNGGNWYACAEFGLEGWLCPALNLYYPDAPKRLYVQVREAK